VSEAGHQHSKDRSSECQEAVKQAKPQKMEKTATQLVHDIPAMKHGERQEDGSCDESHALQPWQPAHEGEQQEGGGKSPDASQAAEPSEHVNESGLSAHQPKEMEHGVHLATLHGLPLWTPHTGVATPFAVVHADESALP
jgi:hypothetical protein